LRNILKKGTPGRIVATTLRNVLFTRHLAKLLSIPVNAFTPGLITADYYVRLLPESAGVLQQVVRLRGGGGGG